MKAVVLYSGGLDSCLVLEMIKEWNVEVFPLYISHHFLQVNLHPNLDNLKIVDVSEEFFTILRNPKFGYGKNLNPCIDCRILMLKKAKRYMAELNADFVVTGEVIGQRPMSQRRDTINLIEREAELKGMVVRPLCGGLLPPTIPEKNGLVRRDRLLKVKGRSRKFELALAKRKGITNFFSPSGGCLLTDPRYSRRLADLMRYQETISLADIALLKLGRHFRLSPETKLIVGRNECENNRLEKLFDSKYILLYVPDTGSPNSILIGNKGFLKTAAAITARYSDKNTEKRIEVCYQQKGGVNKITVAPIHPEQLNHWRL